MLMSQAGQTALTILIGAAGALLAWLFGLPAPFLIGPAIAVTVAGLAGLDLEIAVGARDTVFVVLGASMGQSVTPEVLDAATRWPVTLGCLGILLVAIIWLTQQMLRRFWQLDRATGLLSASPGHLSYVLGLTEGVRADLPFVSIVQSIRVLSLTVCVPFAVALAGPLSSAEAIASPQVMALPALLAVLLLSGAAGFAFNQVKLPAAYLMGGLIVSAALHASDLTAGVVPPVLQIGAFVIMGSLIGTRFSGVTLPDLRRSLAAGLAVTLLAVILAAGFALLAAELTGFPPTALLIAFAPGGVETMAAMSVILGLDPTFVAAHHVARLLMLTVIVPLFVIRRSRDSEAA